LVKKNGVGLGGGLGLLKYGVKGGVGGVKGGVKVVCYVKNNT